MTAHIDDLLDRVWSRRRAAGLTVVFERQDGGWDEWGFRDTAQRDSFIYRLNDRGQEHHIPAWQA